jgi:23S rRNA (pseudouridine1915-N3)-methyltransferase
MRFELLFLGKTKEKYLEQGIVDFGKRLARYVDVDLRVLKGITAGEGEPGAKLKEEEGRLLLSRITPGALIVALDPGGRMLSSEELAAQISRWENDGRRTIAFLIGGHLGLAPEILARADFVLSLSLMTFTHEMTRLLLLEQLYRARTILAGTGYHK